ncbi:alpha/beta fold hydrolase [Salinactinospora qingdaonensis]|uniref:3-oxoadipate enol-lactonase n=1 Tax=Salinactinospora qingdaonensis TaxID=702744 RepID=A0ABP7F454_9ACTN
MALVPLQHRFDGPRHAPVVILLPALGTQWSMWAPQMAELTRSARVLRVNHRGHGASPAPEGSYSIAELGGDILDLLDSYDQERFSVIGAGLGGVVGLWLAAAEPERVRRMALLCTTACPPAARWRRIGRRVRTGGMAEVQQEATRPWFTPGFTISHPGTVTRLGEEFGATATTGYAGCCDALTNADQRHKLGQIRAATLVISAAHDPATPPGHGQRLADGIPEAQLEIVEGAAHLANIEQGDRVNELLRKYVVH